jgi:hypothetical protein
MIAVLLRSSHGDCAYPFDEDDRSGRPVRGCRPDRFGRLAVTDQRAADLVRAARQAGEAVKFLDRLAALIPAVDCCPHLDMGDDPDTAYLPADTTRRDYRGGA